MGIIYRLKPEIRDFILEQKKTNQALSCRGLAALVKEKFQIELSKSSINAMIKEAGLSMPVGRRVKKKRLHEVAEPQPLMVVEAKPEVPTEEVKLPEEIKPPEEPKPEMPLEVRAQFPSEIPCTGAIFLKAADYLLGGCDYFSATIKNRFNRQDKNFLTKTEALIYLPLFEGVADKDLAGLWAIIGEKLSRESILSYLNDLQLFKTINSDILRVISRVIPEVRSIKVNFADGSTLYLDGQMHTVWSAPNIPNDFSSTICNVKSYIDKYFSQNQPFVLFMAPGYESPSAEFFTFLFSFDQNINKITKLTLHGHKFEELETIQIEGSKNRNFIFGLWPWQFSAHRKINKVGDFRPYSFAPAKKDFFIADVEIVLSQPNVNKSVTLRGWALKTNLTERARLLVLTNLSTQAAPIPQALDLYLSHWPNLEEAFQDTSRKVELFTYTANSQRFFSAETLKISKDPEIETKMLFQEYLEALDAYVRWHFLPAGCENWDFPTRKAQIYGLKGILKTEGDCARVTFLPPPEFRCLKELEYACRRVNEREVILRDGRRLWFSF